ncbi:MAG: hypothetical protein IPL46_21460 [Saprospiraceae bacterium]|nr:hypothetical protein [Saprospiraceae bacterium]
MYGNEAGLAHLDHLSAYASAERRFNNEGLNFYSLLGAVPTKFGNFGVSLFYHGYENYNEQLFAIAYARKLIDQLAIGVRFDLVQARIPTYGKTSTATAEFGIQSEISQSVILGAHLYNPFQIEWLENETLPTIFLLGLAYSPTPKIWISGEVEKVSDFKENIKWGIQYSFLEELAIRIGFNTNPALVSFGFGYSLTSGFSFDAGSSVHQELGFSPLGGIGYRVKN